MKSVGWWGMGSEWGARRGRHRPQGRAQQPQQKAPWTTTSPCETRPAYPPEEGTHAQCDAVWLPRSRPARRVRSTSLAQRCPAPPLPPPPPRPAHPQKSLRPRAAPPRHAAAFARTCARARTRIDPRASHLAAGAPFRAPSPSSHRARARARRAPGAPRAQSGLLLLLLLRAPAPTPAPTKRDSAAEAAAIPIPPSLAIETNALSAEGRGKMLPHAWG